MYATLLLASLLIQAPATEPVQSAPPQAVPPQRPPPTPQLQWIRPQVMMNSLIGEIAGCSVGALGGYFLLQPWIRTPQELESLLLPGGLGFVGLIVGATIPVVLLGVEANGR